VEDLYRRETPDRPNQGLKGARAVCPIMNACFAASPRLDNSEFTAFSGSKYATRQIA
jgi:hypothetical protein